MPRLDQLPEIQRKTLLMHSCQDNEDVPWTPLGVPLARARVALVTTAGLHNRNDAPFTPGDTSFRSFPSDTPAGELVQSHTSIGFDRSAILGDLNVVLPRDRLRELAGRGEIGSLAPEIFSFMGAQRRYEGLMNDSGPEVARLLRGADVDAVLLTGT